MSLPTQVPGQVPPPSTLARSTVPSLLVLLLVGGAPPALAGEEEKSFGLPEADVRVEIQPDGSLRIEEDITFVYDGSFSGAFREIPLRPWESIDDVFVAEAGRMYSPGASAEIGSAGAPDTFGVARTGESVRIVWHYRAKTEFRTYTVGYRFRGLAVAYDDVVDVNLQVWGDEWGVPLGGLTASMSLPGPASGPDYRVFAHPAWVQGEVTQEPDGAGLRAFGISAGQFVELRVVFPRDLLTSTQGAAVLPGQGLDRILAEERADAESFESDRARIDSWRNNLGLYIPLLLLIGLSPALLLIGATWWFFGRERRTGYDRDYEQEPPSDLAPALVPPLLRQSTVVGSHEFTATLFDLIRRGRYEARPVTTEASLWGGLRKEQVADLELSAGDGKLDDAKPFERNVMRVVDDVLRSGPERLSQFRDRISDDRESHAPRFQSFKRNVAASIKRRRWFAGGGRRLLFTGAGAFAVPAVLLMWIGIANLRPGFPRPSDIVIIALGACAALNAAVLLHPAVAAVRLWRRRTRKAQVEAERWDAFRRYLTDFPRLDIAPPATLELWERFLVYGIALGIAERVLQGAQILMPAEVAQASSIYWISPHSDLGSGASALAIGDLSSGFGSALAPPSSGGGGGFSGGGGFGGGGGGGGAW